MVHTAHTHHHAIIALVSAAAVVDGGAVDVAVVGIEDKGAILGDPVLLVVCEGFHGDGFGEDIDA